MKYCNKCNAEYGEEKMFCPVCGNKLSMVKAQTSDGKGISVDDADKRRESFFDRWGAVLFVVIGLIIEWEINWLVGCAVAISGMFIGRSSSNQANKLLSIVMGIIAILGAIVCIL